MATKVETEERVEIVKAPEHEMLRSGPVTASPIGVDDEAKVIRGRVIAQLGKFKTGRGEFDDASLKTVVKLVNKAGETGLKARYGHPKLDGSSQDLDSFIGRDKNARLDGDKVRTDLHLDPVAFMSPNGGTSRGDYLLARAKSDPNSFGSSLVLMCDKKYRLDNRGHKKLDEDGEVLPPIWNPTSIVSSDIVDDGDAVHGGFLNAGDELFAGATIALDGIADLDRETLSAYFGEYLSHRFGELAPPPAGDDEPVTSGDSGFGFCPECGAEGVSRKNGKDKCANGHEYPSSEALPEPLSNEPDAELLRLRWENQKRKAGVS